jgi:hypothetical protein
MGEKDAVNALICDYDGKKGKLSPASARSGIVRSIHRRERWWPWRAATKAAPEKELKGAVLPSTRFLKL